MTIQKVIMARCDRCGQQVQFSPDEAENSVEVRVIMSRSSRWHCCVQGPDTYLDAAFDKDYCPDCYPFIVAGLNHASSCDCAKCQEIAKKLKT